MSMNSAEIEPGPSDGVERPSLKGRRATVSLAGRTAVEAAPRARTIEERFIADSRLIGKQSPNHIVNPGDFLEQLRGFIAVDVHEYIMEKEQHIKKLDHRAAGLLMLPSQQVALKIKHLTPLYYQMRLKQPNNIPLLNQAGIFTQIALGAEDLFLEIRGANL